MSNHQDAVALRDSIAKELFIVALKTNGASVPAENIATVAFDTADVFMQEKFKRDRELVRSNISGTLAGNRNPIG